MPSPSDSLFRARFSAEKCMKMLEYSDINVMSIDLYDSDQDTTYRVLYHSLCALFCMLVDFFIFIEF